MNSRGEVGAEFPGQGDKLGVLAGQVTLRSGGAPLVFGAERSA